MNNPTNDEINATLRRLECPRIKFVAHEPQLLPRQPPPTMEWSDKERRRLTTFMGQATRYRKRSLLARLFGWAR